MDCDLLQKIELLHAAGTQIIPPDAKEIGKTLYEILTILDGKGLALLAFDSTPLLLMLGLRLLRCDREAGDCGGHGCDFGLLELLLGLEQGRVADRRVATVNRRVGA